MHEASLIGNLLESAVETMKRHGGNRVVAMKLRVGALAGVVPEALNFAFDALKTTTPAALARLEIDWHPARLECLSCGDHYTTEEYPDLCPACGGAQSRVLCGAELDLVSVELARDG